MYVHVRHCSNTVLYCVILCYTMLYYVILCYTVLYCVILCYTVLLQCKYADVSTLLAQNWDVNLIHVQVMVVDTRNVLGTGK